MFPLISRPLDMLNLYFNALLQYTRIEGQASRSEFCLFYGINSLILSVLSGPELNPETPLQFTLAVLLPSITLGIRRMHDCGKSGWYFFIPGYNLILVFSKRAPRVNESELDTQDLLCRATSIPE